MTAEEKVRRAFARMADKMEGSFFATVVNNNPDKDYIAVEDLNGVLYEDVRKRASIKGGTDGIVITPAPGSSVIVSRISDSDELFIEMFSEVDTIVIDGGSFGGMVKINELTSRINALIDKVNDHITKYNSHTHIVNTTGSASAQTGTAQAVVSKASAASKFVASDYENEKIKH